MKIDIETLIHHLHECSIATLGTHSQHCEGYPFVTVVPVALDEMHRPVILISRLAEHTKNLLADPRTSVLMYKGSTDNVLADKRVTLVGKTFPVGADEVLANRYCRYHPDAVNYLSLGDFSFFRLDLEKIRFISGFGATGWSDVSSFSEVSVLEVESEQKIIEELAGNQSEHLKILGLDFYGIDIEINGKRERRSYPYAPIEITSLIPIARQTLQNIL